MQKVDASKHCSDASHSGAKRYKQGSFSDWLMKRASTEENLLGKVLDESFGRRREEGEERGKGETEEKREQSNEKGYEAIRKHNEDCRDQEGKTPNRFHPSFLKPPEGK